MSIETQIIEARGGDLIVGIHQRQVSDIQEAANSFGLFSSPEIYEEITTEEAKAVLLAALNRDLAYGVEIVSESEAKKLANDFVGQFTAEAKFFTNGEYGKPRKSVGVGPSWSPATEATFDTGILVIDSTCVACAWFKDED